MGYHYHEPCTGSGWTYPRPSRPKRVTACMAAGLRRVGCRRETRVWDPELATNLWVAVLSREPDMADGRADIYTHPYTARTQPASSPSPRPVKRPAALGRRASWRAVARASWGMPVCICKGLAGSRLGPVLVHRPGAIRERPCSVPGGEPQIEWRGLWGCVLASVYPRGCVLGPIQATQTGWTCPGAGGSVVRPTSKTGYFERRRCRRPRRRDGPLEYDEGLAMSHKTRLPGRQTGRAAGFSGRRPDRRCLWKLLPTRAQTDGSQRVTAQLLINISTRGVRAGSFRRRSKHEPAPEGQRAF